MNASAVKSESFYHSLLRHQLQSFTLFDGLHPLLSVAQTKLLKRKDRHDSDEEVNVIGEGRTHRNKTENPAQCMGLFHFFPGKNNRIRECYYPA